MPKKTAVKRASKLSLAFLFDDSLDSDAGVAQYVKAVGGWMSAQGHSVTYLVGESKLQDWRGDKVFSLSKNIRVRWNGNRVGISVWPKTKLIKSVIAEHQFDVVHVMVPYSPFMAQRVINKLKPTTAVVGSFHIFPANWLSATGSRLLKILYGRSLKRFDTFLSVSEAAKAYARSIFNVDSAVSPNVVEAARFRAADKRAGAKARIVFLGRLVERKGCAQLIKAFAHADPAKINAELIIAGDGPLKADLQKLTRSLGVTENVSFLGYITEEEKPVLLAGADIACFPSLNGESFGIVLIEAMAAGSKVVLGGDNPGYRSVLGGYPDLLFDPTKSAEFAAKIKKYLTNPKAAAAAHEWQTGQVKHYDIEHVGPQLVRVYQEAIDKRSASNA